MDEPQSESEAVPFDLTRVVLIVVGAHLRAEEGDRPLAYQLMSEVERWVESHSDRLETPLRPMVCTDALYLNDEVLHERATISVGGPGVNALSAYFAQQMEGEAALRPDQVIIQMDPDFADLRVAIWGVNHATTEQGVDLFIETYLDGFLRAVATQVEPRDG
ncbi:hypothetical protein [Mucisphaera calidilacus]|uniref:Uncharacterized protein n=1 Tax=Mucisphaera calidilacus TaxID=2527982 RepID=A0A518BXU4_9BACT|nr:hypothetical protein [Mucisphaera calidilacus]QDU71792.1 hypothetical protein Pan265_16450 [Mucisphaera calidilacus]